MKFGDERLPARFWSKVQVDTVTGCWIWTAGCNRQGSGMFWDGEESVYVHRFAYEALVGPIPVGRHLRRRCDDPDCMNPAHRELRDRNAA